MSKNKFFHMNMGVWKLLLMAIVMCGALAIVGLDIAILAGAVDTGFPEVAWVSLVAAALVLVLALIMLLMSGYGFEEDHMIVRLGFFKDKIKYEDITQLKRDGDSGKYYLIFGDEVSGTNVRVDISASKYDDFESELRKHLPTIAVETFVLPKKGEKK